MAQQQRGQRLVLSHCGDLPIDRKRRLKRLHLPSPHLARMPLAVKQDEPTHPLHVLRLRADAVMLDTNSVTHLIEQLGTLRYGGV